MKGSDAGRDISQAVEVLLIEDNPGDVRLAQDYFRHSRAKVNLSVVSSGEEALLLLTTPGRPGGTSWPDLILLDLGLPGLDGPGVLRALRTNSRFAAVPIIVMTTSVAPEDVLICYELKANAYVIKPNGLDKLFEAFSVIDKFWMRTVVLPGTTKVRPIEFS